MSAAVVSLGMHQLLWVKKGLHVACRDCSLNVFFFQPLGLSHIEEVYTEMSLYGSKFGIVTLIFCHGVRSSSPRISTAQYQCLSVKNDIAVFNSVL